MKPWLALPATNCGQNRIVRNVSDTRRTRITRTPSITSDRRAGPVSTSSERGGNIDVT